MRTFLTALIAAGLCFAQTFAQAQQPAGKLSGRVLEADRQPAIAATVTLLKAKDSTSVITTLTNVDGEFILEKLNAGEYLISISAIGFDKYQTSLISLKESSDMNMPDIILHPGSTALKGVSVTAQKPLVEQLLDRTVVNVDAFISNTGATALEALEKVPGLIVDDNGTITYKGRSGVRVLVDDRPTYLSGENLANYLRSLPASQLDKIELMSNPPARYDAAGNAGIINIRTKKIDQKGFNGSLNASIGKAAYWRSIESLALNYRVNKLNFFLNSGYNLGKSYRRLDVDRHYFDSSGVFKSGYTEEAYFRNLSSAPNIRAGLDYFLSPKNTLGIIVTGSVSNQRSSNPITSRITDKTGGLDSTILADNHSKYSFKNGGINLNYVHQFDSLGKSLSFDASYLRYDNMRDQNFQNTTYDAAGAFGAFQNIIASIPTIVNIYAAKSDFTMPLANKIKLSAGVKASFVNTDNAANYFNVIDADTTVNLDNTNHFIYHENIQAGYISLNQDSKRFSWQLGLRGEHTDVSGYQYGNLRSKDSAVVQHYFSLFPTAFFSYKIDTAGHHQLIASYGRRIDRPNYQDLNPFVVILDKYSAFQGNPFLRPQYSNNYQLSYNYQNIIIFALNYSRVTDFQTENDYQQGNIFAGGFVNLGHATTRSASVNVSVSPVKCWNMNDYVELTDNTYEGQLTTSYLNVSKPFLNVTVNNQFALGEGWSAELSGFYNGSRVWAQFVHEPEWSVNTGLSKKIIHNKASIKLSARDIFNRYFSGGDITNLAGMTAHYRNDNANRSLTLGFSYNFGSTIKNQRKHDSAAADSEAKRAQN